MVKHGRPIKIPKGSKRFRNGNLDVFDNFGPIWTLLDHFRQKINLLLHKDKVWQIFDGSVFIWTSGQFFTCLKQIHKVLLKFEQNLGLNLVILEILNAMDRHKEHMKISKMLSSTPSFRLLEHNTKQRMRISKMQLIVELPRSGCLRALATNFKMTHCAPGDFIIRDFQLPSSSLSSSSI